MFIKNFNYEKKLNRLAQNTKTSLLFSPKEFGNNSYAYEPKIFIYHHVIRQIQSSLFRFNENWQHRTRIRKLEYSKIITVTRHAHFALKSTYT